MGQSLAVAMPCPMDAPPAYSVLQPEGLISGVVAPVIKNLSVQSEGDLYPIRPGAHRGFSHLRAWSSIRTGTYTVPARC